MAVDHCPARLWWQGSIRSFVMPPRQQSRVCTCFFRPSPHHRQRTGALMSVGERRAHCSDQSDRTDSNWCSAVEVKFRFCIPDIDRTPSPGLILMTCPWHCPYLGATPIGRNDLAAFRLCKRLQQSMIFTIGALFVCSCELLYSMRQDIVVDDTRTTGVVPGINGYRVRPFPTRWFHEPPTHSCLSIWSCSSNMYFGGLIPKFSRDFSEAFSYPSRLPTVLVNVKLMFLNI